MDTGHTLHHSRFGRARFQWPDLTLYGRQVLVVTGEIITLIRREYLLPYVKIMIITTLVTLNSRVIPLPPPTNNTRTIITVPSLGTVRYLGTVILGIPVWTITTGTPENLTETPGWTQEWTHAWIPVTLVPRTPVILGLKTLVTHVPTTHVTPVPRTPVTLVPTIPVWILEVRILVWTLGVVTHTLTPVITGILAIHVTIITSRGPRTLSSRVTDSTPTPGITEGPLKTHARFVTTEMIHSTVEGLQEDEMVHYRERAR